jgi:glycosyltransferase involved in cell wall biosynthesis
MRPIMAGMARWDAGTAGRVNRFLANSQYVAGRIRRYYNRRSTVVYPPVDTEFYRPDPSGPSGPGALVVSALVPYKRLDIALEACRLARVPLKVVGQGPEEARLRGASGADVQWLGWRSDEEIRELYGQAAVVLLPGTEDFGIVPVEAQACGTPVVAYAEGGARETVIPGHTGALVDEPSAAAFAAAIRDIVDRAPDRGAIRANAERFSVAEFKRRFQGAVHGTVPGTAS